MHTSAKQRWTSERKCQIHADDAGLGEVRQFGSPGCKTSTGLGVDAQSERHRKPCPRKWKQGKSLQESMPGEDKNPNLSNVHSTDNKLSYRGQLLEVMGIASQSDGTHSGSQRVCVSSGWGTNEGLSPLLNTGADPCSRMWTLSSSRASS